MGAAGVVIVRLVVVLELLLLLLLMLLLLLVMMMGSTVGYPSVAVTGPPLGPTGLGVERCTAGRPLPQVARVATVAAVPGQDTVVVHLVNFSSEFRFRNTGKCSLSLIGREGERKMFCWLPRTMHLCCMGGEWRAFPKH